MLHITPSLRKGERQPDEPYVAKSTLSNVRHFKESEAMLDFLYGGPSFAENNKIVWEYLILILPPEFGNAGLVQPSKSITRPEGGSSIIRL